LQKDCHPGGIKLQVEKSLFIFVGFPRSFCCIESNLTILNAQVTT